MAARKRTPAQKKGDEFQALLDNRKEVEFELEQLNSAIQQEMAEHEGEIFMLGNVPYRVMKRGKSHYLQCCVAQKALAKMKEQGL